MNEIIAPLTQIAGVRMAALITPDGVPISLVRSSQRSNAPQERSLPEDTEDFAAYAGLAAGWLGQVGRATDPLTWDRPRRAVLRGTRGTLIMNRADNAILMVITEQGIGAEELRLPMESALARMQRHLKGGTATKAAPAAASATRNPVEPSSLFPRSEGVGGKTTNSVKNSFSDKTGGV